MSTIATLKVRGRSFEIVFNGTHYCAIEDRYIDNDGRINTALNGIQMHASTDYNQCIELVWTSCFIDSLREEGWSEEQILKIVFNI